MKITYYAADGYVGKDRHLHCNVDDDEILAADSNEEAFVIVDDAIEEAFQQRVSCDYDQHEIRQRIVALRDNAG